jgi:hypothetical protein
LILSVSMSRLIRRLTVRKPKHRRTAATTAATRNI